MGQKVRPIGLRLGINRTWESRWFAKPDQYAKLLHQDLSIRKMVRDTFPQAGISRVIIERPAKKAIISVFSSRPGLIIGKKGADIDRLKGRLARITGDDVSLNVVEIRKPELDARLVAEGVAQQLTKRMSYRRAMKRAIQQTMKMGAEGIKVICSGRLGGAEIARVESYREGRVPLHTLRADVDYAEVPAHTTYGTCGVKVWIFKGEIMEHDPMAHEARIRSQSNIGKSSGA
ncbi:30S ribosomal protein S3 [Alphaproteobacteria bacterium]|nr:30S ribosomal protein S3 [Alphaproteobacteria bacterium]